MNNDTIPALEQFIEPAPVQFTYTAPGWYAVEVVAVLLLLVIAGWMLWRYHKNKYRRVALKKLQQQSSLQGYADIVYNANMVMKQVSMSVYNKQECADLRGKDWLDFLNRTSTGKIFEEKDEKIVSSIYSSDNKLDEAQAIAFTDKAKQWIKKHKHAVRHRHI